jgi:hypothetical protein
MATFFVLNFSKRFRLNYVRWKRGKFDLEIVPESIKTDKSAVADFTGGMM